MLDNNTINYIKNTTSNFTKFNYNTVIPYITYYDSSGNIVSNYDPNYYYSSIEYNSQIYNIVKYNNSIKIYDQNEKLLEIIKST